MEGTTARRLAGITVGAVAAATLTVVGTAAHAVEINDNDSRITYDPAYWTRTAPVLASTKLEAKAELSVDLAAVSNISVVMRYSPQGGRCYVSLDGKMQKVFDTQEAATTSKTAYTLQGVPAGTHTIAVQVGAVTAGRGSQCALDTFYVVNAPNGTTPIADLKYEQPALTNRVRVVVTNDKIKMYKPGMIALDNPANVANEDAGGWVTDLEGGNHPLMPKVALHAKVTFGNTEDVEWILPGHPLNAQTAALDRPYGLFIQGGNDHVMNFAEFAFGENYVRSIGGNGGNNPTGTGFMDEANRALRLLNWTGEFSIMGVHWAAGHLYETLNFTNNYGVQQSRPKLTLQRSRGDRVDWLEYVKDSKKFHDGGDFIQMFNGGPEVQLYDVTSTTTFQSIFLSYNDAASSPSTALFGRQDIRRTNIYISNPDTEAVINTKVRTGTTPPPTYYKDVLVKDTSGNTSRPFNDMLITFGTYANVPGGSPARECWTWKPPYDHGYICEFNDGDNDFAPLDRTGKQYSGNGWPKPIS